MRILIVAPPLDGGGPLPKLTPLLVSGLRTRGCVVALLPWGGSGRHESVARKIGDRIRDIGRVRRALRRQPIDVLMVETAHDWATLSRDLALVFATRGLCRRTILHFHGSDVLRLAAPGQFLFRLASKLLVNRADAAFVLSTEEQRQWQSFHRRGHFYRVDNPYLAPLPVDVEAYRARMGLSAERPVMLFVGRLMESKGVLDLIAALQLVPFHLLIAGAGPLEREVRTAAVAAGVADRLTMAGYLEGDDLQAAYQLADVFVLPTRHAEGFPLAIVEAMAAGLPVVTTRIRGMADHLRDGINAIFVPGADPRAIAGAVTRIVSDRDLRERMSRANRDKVNEFAPESVSLRFVDLLRDLIER